MKTNKELIELFQEIDLVIITKIHCLSLLGHVNEIQMLERTLAG